MTAVLIILLSLMIFMVFIVFFPVNMSLIFKNQSVSIRFLGIPVYKIDMTKKSDGNSEKNTVNHDVSVSSKDDCSPDSASDKSDVAVQNSNLEKLKNITGRISSLIDYARNNEQKTLDQAKKIIKIKKIKLDVEFGASNPYRTGIITGYLFFAKYFIISISRTYIKLFDVMQLNIKSNFQRKLLLFNGIINFNINISKAIYVALKLSSMMKHSKNQAI